MKEKQELAFVGDGRDGEDRDLGVIPATPEAVRNLLRKLAARFRRLYVCYEAGPTGYGLYRQVILLERDRN